MPRLDRRLLLLSCLALLGAAPVRGQPPAKERQALADRHGDPLPPWALARLGTVRLRHAAEVLCLAFSPDGKTLASGGANGTVRLWDPATGQHAALKGHTGPVYSVAFGPDGKTLASGGWDGTLRLWPVPAR